jgi:hypothetical protein
VGQDVGMVGRLGAGGPGLESACRRWPSGSARLNDPDTGELTTSTAADPHTIATDITDWVSR